MPCDVGRLQLTKSNDWAVNTLYAFTDGADGLYPNSGVILDQVGNLYGTCWIDNSRGDGGDVFELTPSGSRWTFNMFNSLVVTTDVSLTPLFYDQAGNLYGAILTRGIGRWRNSFSVVAFRR